MNKKRELSRIAKMNFYSLVNEAGYTSISGYTGIKKRGETEDAPLQP